MKIYMIGGTDSHVKCGVKDYTLELQRYLEQPYYMVHMDSIILRTLES